VVDRLLQSPRYGERMAVPWLDVVRYADTVGFHGDQNQNAWAYRDYVIQAFNSNKPFDQFTREQLAGDLLPNPTPETRTATCFTRLTMMTREGGAQPKEYLAKYAADRVRTVGMAWLGSTLACCECHDHKFDPFLTKDFYSLGAFFADIKQWGVYADYDYTPNPELRGVGNDHPFPPEIQVDSTYLEQRIVRTRERERRIVLENDPQQAAARPAFDAWRQESLAFLTQHPDGWETAAAPEMQVQEAAEADRPAEKPAPPNAAFSHAEPDGSLLITAAAPANIALRFRPQTARVAALRIELLPHTANGGGILRAGGSPGTLSVSASVQRAAGGPAQPVAFRYASANFAEPRYDSGFEIIGVQSGWKLSESHTQEANRSTWILDTPLTLEPGDRMTLTFRNAKVGCLRIAASPFAPETPEAAGPAATLREALADPVAATRQDVRLAYLAGTAWKPEAFAQLKAQEADYLACRGGRTPVMVAVATTPLVTRVLPRGNWQNESGEIVQPAVPHFLPQPKNTGTRLTRLDLANWLVSPDNPLTSRVFVNRLWKQFFGVGLSDTVEDLGAQGEWPGQPELLDWLAVEFRKSGWNIKHMVRLIVISSAYQQSSRPRPELRSIDPANRLFASQNPRRLDAEFVRDNALAISGLLCTDLGGPPCKPYQPAGYYANIQFPDRDYIADRDERQWRRGVYMHWQRTFLHPMLANFGAPSREDCIAARTIANTPQQALTLLNDPEFVEAARAFALRLLAGHPTTDAGRLDSAYALALSRAPRPRERQSLLAFLASVREAYRTRPDDAKKLLAIGYAPVPAGSDAVELAAWTSVCRVLLNLHETITRY
jgi:hypothetical protein